MKCDVYQKNKQTEDRPVFSPFATVMSREGEVCAGVEG